MDRYSLWLLNLNPEPNTPFPEAHLIARMLDPNPFSRPSSSELLAKGFLAL
jgi:hypothetical protein